MSHSEKYEGTAWIDVPWDESACDNHLDLENLHINKASFLIAEIRKLAGLLDQTEKELAASKKHFQQLSDQYRSRTVDYP